MERKTRDLLIRGGRVIDPASDRDEVCDVFIKNGRIEDIGVGLGLPDGITELQATGLVVAPGFVDPHCHLRQPGYEYKETIATAAAAAAAGGFTTVCAMANTNPVVDTKSTLENVQEIAAGQHSVNVYTLAAITIGLEGKQLVQMGELSDAGAVGFSDDGMPLASSAMMRHALEYAKRFNRPVANHCEDPGLTGGAAMNEGATSLRLGLPATPVQAEEVMIARDLALAELTGGRYHALHVSAARSVDLIRSAKNRGANVTAEVTPHHLTLSDEIVAGRWEPISASLRPYDPVTKVNPPLRSAEDVEAVRAGLADGTIDCVGTDHAPHADYEKRVDYAGAAAGFSGLETAFGAVMELVDGGAMDLTTLIERLTRGASVYELPHGSLARGGIADVVVFDPVREWVVDVAAFKSKGKNSPFHGQTFRGRVLKTIRGGRVVFDLSEDPIEAVGALGS